MKNVLVWGMGEFYQAWKKWMPPDYRIIGWINGAREEKKTADGLPVYLPEEIEKIRYDQIVLAVFRQSEFLERLEHMGIPQEKIVQLQPDGRTIFPGRREKGRKTGVFYGVNQNAGDLLNAFLMNSLFGAEVSWADLERAELTAIGSILNLNFNYENKQTKNPKKLIVWGTGFMDSPRCRETGFYRDLDIRALRGRYSGQIVWDVLGKKINAAFGDPGILVSDLKIRREKKYEIGLIPHCREADNALMRSAAKDPAVHLIDMRGHPVQVLEKIAACEAVASSSLHGIILADSFRIPNVWLRLGRYTKGNTLFKYWDYFSNFQKQRTPVLLTPETRLDAGDIKKHYPVGEDEIFRMKEAMRQSWPFREESTE